jgi:ATP-dependent exoDNAse (exonuclease V) beta subunit
VILYGFFANSPFSRWRILESAGTGSDEFNPLADQVLLFELKQLYVAVTRARSHLFIYDGSETGDFIRKYLASRKLVASIQQFAVGHKSLIIAKGSTAETWFQRGSDFMDRSDYQARIVNSR